MKVLTQRSFEYHVAPKPKQAPGDLSEVAVKLALQCPQSPFNHDFAWHRMIALISRSSCFVGPREAEPTQSSLAGGLKGSEVCCRVWVLIHWFHGSGRSEASPP